MKTLDFVRFSVGICVASALLAGCSASQAVGEVPTPRGIDARSDRGPSWMVGDAKGKALLYVSDQGTMDVYVYSYPKGKLEGTLTGFDEPSGECSDKKGNVFIINGFAQQILEYAHGGTSPIETLSDSGEFPSGCSVDSVTGNLAVTNYCSGTSGCSGTGGLYVYIHAKGSPKKYSDSGISNAYFCGYDNNGNLFVDGALNSAFAFAELPAGKRKFTSITLDQSIEGPGNVQWDGTDLAVADTSAGIIYQFVISGTSGTKVGSTTLEGSSYVTQFWIQGSTVIGPNYLGSKVGNVEFWKYPAGGNPTKTISGLSIPVAATVSI